jgi:hypothetical protein
MASTIQLKRGTGDTAPSSLAEGEFAISLDQGKLYYGSGSAVLNSFKFTNITASGNISSSGTIHAKLNAGTDNSVVVLNSSNQLVTDEIDAGVWGGAGTVVTTEGEHVAPNATAAATVATQRTNTSAAFYPVFVDSNNSTATNESLKTSTNGLSYNPGAQTLTVTTITNISTTHITASGNISSSGNITAENVRLPGAGIISFDDALDGTDQFIKGGEHYITIEGDDFIKMRADDEVRFQDNSGTVFASINPNAGHITSSGNISASGTITADKVYDNIYHTWEVTTRVDSDDDDNWQGPNTKGIHTMEDWTQDYGTDYDDISSTNAEGRTGMNTGWRIPDGANYSCSLKSMDIYVQPNDNITYADADGFSCSIWYSHHSDLVGEQNIPDSNAGNFTQRFGASVNSLQCKAADEKFFKYNNYHVSQSINLDLAPGSIVFPRFKSVGTNDFIANVYWIINYTKTPL